MATAEKFVAYGVPFSKFLLTPIVDKKDDSVPIIQLSEVIKTPITHVKKSNISLLKTLSCNSHISYFLSKNIAFSIYIFMLKRPKELLKLRQWPGVKYAPYVP